MNEFEKLIDDKITKLIWNERGKRILWLEGIKNILTPLCLLRLENQWLISNDIARTKDEPFNSICFFHDCFGGCARS